MSRWRASAALGAYGTALGLAFSSGLSAQVVTVGAARWFGTPHESDYRVSIIDAPGADAYPISSMTWALLYQNQADKAKGKELVKFLKYGLTDGQASAKELDYAPLPSAMVARLLKRLDTVK